MLGLCLTSHGSPNTTLCPSVGMMSNVAFSRWLPITISAERTSRSTVPLPMAPPSTPLTLYGYRLVSHCMPCSSTHPGLTKSMWAPESIMATVFLPLTSMGISKLVMVSFLTFETMLAIVLSLDCLDLFLFLDFWPFLFGLLGYHPDPSL